MYFLPTLLFTILLLRGGVDPNPGPVYTCRSCELELKSVKEYFDHHQIQHPSSNNVPCLYANCDYSSFKLSTLQSHLSRCPHKPAEEAVLFLCPVTSCAAHSLVTTKRTFMQHLREHLERNESFKCPFDDCQFVHRQLSVFGSHVSRFHETQPAFVSQPNNSRSTTAASISQLGSAGSTLTPCVSQPGTSRSTAPASLSQPRPSRSSTPASLSQPRPSRSSMPTSLSKHGSASQANPSPSTDPFPPWVVKNEVLKFYVQLEGEHVIPSSTVQFISENVAKFSEMSHHSLKRTLQKELKALDLDNDSITNVMNKVFLSDPVFNVHHKNHDAEQVSSIYFRKKMLMTKMPYVEPVEVVLGRDETGKRKLAHRVPVKETLETLLKDPKVKDEILKSFSLVPNEDGVLRDFRDGSAFKEHLKIHPKCIHLILFQDAFEHNPFGPARGKYKTIGMYYVIGNFPPELRSQVDKILLAFLIQEHFLKTSEAEHLNGCKKFQEAFKSFIDELKDLQLNGVIIGDETIPVCILFVAGDNLGAHQIGSFVQSFSSEYCCRFCPMSMKDFKKEPWKCCEFRTPEQYEECSRLAEEKWKEMRTRSLEHHSRTKELQAERGEKVSQTMVSKSALTKLRSVHHLGVKPIPSALNDLPNFHVCKDGLPSCLAHDLYQGVIDTVLIKILKHFIVDKEWFNLDTLNRRITNFQCKCSDAADAPTAISNFDSINGHACETWTFVRLLPFMIEDLIPDKENEYWELYLQLKEICEYVCAPQITVEQVAQLDHLIKLHLCKLKKLLPSCLTPKTHFLRHYSDLILRYGPLIRMFTMRFESKHIFFKKVARMCHNYSNITYTQSEKYMYRFAHDQINGLIPPDVICDSVGKTLTIDDIHQDMRSALPPSLDFSQVTAYEELKYKGTLYKVNTFMILDRCELVNLYVGCIEKILLLPDRSVTLCLREYVALNSFQGYFVIDQERRATVRNIESLSDHYPLPTYHHGGKQCLSLNHSLIFM